MERFDEGSVWAAARAGDAEAFATVFDVHRDAVFERALAADLSPTEAEDVTALVFLEAWRRRGAVRVADGTVSAWLLSTTADVVRTLARTRRRHRAILERLPRSSSSVEPPTTTGRTAPASDPTGGAK